MKTQSLQSLLWKFRQNYTLRSITLELTNRCNLNCIHCLRIKNKNELPFEKIKEIVDDAVPLGTFEFTITGGEPTLHKDILRILDYMTARELKITLFTNAVHFKAGFISALKNFSINSIHISFYTLKEDVFDYITRSRGLFKEYMRNIEALAGAGLPVKLKTLVMTMNYPEIEELERYAENLGADWSYNYLIFPRNDFSKDVLRYRVSDEVLCAMKAKGYVGHFDPSRQSTNFYICNMGRTLIDIAADGTVYPCIALRLPAGNIYESKLKDIWHNSSVLQKIRSLRPEDFECSACPHHSYCNRCPGLAYAEYGNYLKKPEESCRITNAFL